MPPVAERALEVGRDFPILERRPGGRPLVYLDSGATSQKPQAVIDALTRHLADHNANVHRGVYPLAQEADAAYDGAARACRRFHRGEPAHDDLHEERDRGDQPRRLRLGPRQHRRRAMRF